MAHDKQTNKPEPNLLMALLILCVANTTHLTFSPGKQRVSVLKSRHLVPAKLELHRCGEPHSPRPLGSEEEDLPLSQRPCYLSGERICDGNIECF